MKRRASILAVFLLIGTMAFAATIGAPAATVRLTKTTPISMADLEAEVAQYKANTVKQGGDPASVDPLQVLNLLINNELFRQGAARDGVKITDAMVESAYDSQKTNLEASTGQKFTDAEFDQIIMNNFGSVDAYRKAIREQLMVDSYVRMKKSDMLGTKVQVSDAEITSFYRKNKTNFISPETVKLSHIYIPFTNDAQKDAQNKALLERVARDIKNGSLSFEKAVVQYSEDAQSKNKAGDIGWLTMDNKEARAGLGDAFFDVAFTTDVGNVSDVVTSNTGYHILKILAYNDTKILQLQDQISPTTSTTVEQYIRSELAAQKQQANYYAAINSLVDDLRKSATINILYK
ncbi:peptidylprolyl isomerase [Sphaerochaeta halotolerans]|uniref:peptidylprolyl isomerase n=1 Tax=Sphaerochaeta halotolerans TaxID=2293840 RepID=UPI0013692042|nr:peptidylprolyl isomerase [Sphaerochaeta halotolerans]MXI85789.1 peptidylprolyl isomerase [Sphaerochaeta halotolerans]